MQGYFSVSMVHQVLTWTTGSLMRVHDFFFFLASIYIWGTLVYILIRRTFVKATQNLTTVNFQVMSVLVQYTDLIAEFGWDVGQQIKQTCNLSCASIP